MMKWNAWGRAGAVLMLVVLAACSGEAPEVPPSQPWLTAPPPPDPKAEVLPAWLVHPVAAAARAEALAELAAEPYIQISPGMASYYAGQEVRIPAAMRPFLVRAVDAPGAAIEVVQSQAGLWLRALGGDPAKLDAAPRVVLLDPTPRAVFVTWAAGGDAVGAAGTSD
ncbi:MAG: hypothetical protein H6977_19420 [Gammaproteobacteria bacterium]|nr:hypothetical protein [Gammaproteobacteria bacterium]